MTTSLPMSERTVSLSACAGFESTRTSFPSWSKAPSSPAGETDVLLAVARVGREAEESGIRVGVEEGVLRLDRDRNVDAVEAGGEVQRVFVRFAGEDVRTLQVEALVPVRRRLGQHLAHVQPARVAPDDAVPALLHRLEAVP